MDWVLEVGKMITECAWRVTLAGVSAREIKCGEERATVARRWGAVASRRTEQQYESDMRESREDTRAATARATAGSFIAHKKRARERRAVEEDPAIEVSTR
jgi:sRNA-binding protein